MRLLTWNCSRGKTAQKLDSLTKLKPDIATLQEVAKLSEAEAPGSIWIGDKLDQGLANLAYGPYSLHQLEDVPDLPKFILPTLVRGPHNFLLITVWAKNESGGRYAEAVMKGVAACEHLIKENPTVVCGDFNSFVGFDKRKLWNHEKLVEQLEGLGLHSAYHAQKGVPHGQEPEGTRFEKVKGQVFPFHIDYCFLPKTWRITYVELGKPQDWPMSDHMPLTVDVEP